MNSKDIRKLSVIKEEILEEMYQTRRASMIRGISHKQLIIYQDYDDEEENVEKLFERISQNINLKDADGKVPICKAIEDNCKKLVEYLVEQEADLNNINTKGQTALALAQELNRTEIVEYLEKTSQEETKDTADMDTLGQLLEAAGLAEG